MPERVMLVEDDRELRELLGEILEDAGYAVAPFATANDALRAFEAGDIPDVVVTDLIMPGMRGQELLAEIRARSPEVNVITITAFGSIDSAIELVKAGAYDYLTKPVSAAEMLLTVEKALRESRVHRAGAREARLAPPPAGFIGSSPAMQDVYVLIERSAATAHPVIVTGESGTGKELVARALHARSGRSTFVAVNCAALPENLLESELFGHERGAFTGADKEKPGLFEAADGGTLFLDEIGELPAALQPKLLRALEEGEIRRLGSTRGRRVDVRVIAATNRDLEEDVAEGRFRNDLFWRLSVIHIHVPPLREHPSDIPLLVEHFLARAGRAPSGSAASASVTISPSAMALLTAYAWPGNVRELRNAIERAAALAPIPELRPEDLPARIRDAGRVAALVSDSAEREAPLRELERAYILDILRRTGGNKTRAADILGLDRKTLYRKLEEYAAEDRSG